jgi:hypothetical protein
VAWDEVAGQSEAEVYSRLFPGRGEHESVFTQPDWDWNVPGLVEGGTCFAGS